MRSLRFYVCVTKHMPALDERLTPLPQMDMVVIPPQTPVRSL